MEKKEKKIGLAINYDYHDYGGMLQSFATQRYLQKQGIESEAINFDNLKGDIRKRKCKYFFANIFDFSIVREKSRIIEKKIMQKTKRKLANGLRERDMAFDRFCITHFNISRTFVDWYDLTNACSDYFYAILVGSDQLWLPSNVVADYYTLSFVPDEVKKIAYATSFGIGSIPKKYKDLYEKFLSRIDYLSARETSGQGIIKETTGRDVQLVCDPTLLLDANDWNEVATKERIIKGKYIFCYFMGDNPEQRSFVKRLAKEKGCKVVSLLHLDQYIPDDEKYVDYAQYNVTPADFLNLVKYADYVCTDSFHGTLFSIIYSRPFFTFKRFNKKASLSTNTRITSLLIRLKLIERLFNGSEDVKIDVEIKNWEEIQKCVCEFRQTSIDYLTKAIKR